MNHKKGIKPRIYRGKRNAKFLKYSKKKNKSKATHRKMNRQLLECANKTRPSSAAKTKYSTKLSL